MNKPFRRRDLLGIRGLSAEEITGILDTAENFSEISTREVKKVPALRGKTVINLFFENSTRTRTSFELAAKRLSFVGPAGPPVEPAIALIHCCVYGLMALLARSALCV